jgi:hypothetical protein
MATIYELRYADGCKEEGLHSGGNRYYVLSEKDFLNVWESPGWCSNCKRTVPLETVPELDELERDVRELNEPQSEQYRKFLSDGIPAEHLEFRRRMLEQQLQWRKKRNSPSHCLVCGGSEVITFSFDRISHPATGKICWLECVGVGCLMYSKYDYYDVDGNQLDLSDEAYLDMDSRRRQWERNGTRR